MWLFVTFRLLIWLQYALLRITIRVLWTLSTATSSTRFLWCVLLSLSGFFFFVEFGVEDWNFEFGFHGFRWSTVRKTTSVSFIFRRVKCMGKRLEAFFPKIVIFARWAFTFVQGMLLLQICAWSIMVSTFWFAMLPLLFKPLGACLFHQLFVIYQWRIFSIDSFCWVYFICTVSGNFFIQSVGPNWIIEIVNQLTIIHGNYDCLNYLLFGTCDMVDG